MKIALYTGLLVVLIIIIVFAFLSISTRNIQPPGLLNGKLQPCPDSPNCVCSEHPHPIAAIEPLQYKADSQQAMAKLKQLIVQQGGVVISNSDTYLHATWTSTLFRFIDDLEIRIAPEQNVIHIRSASRAGRSDFGVNRKRVEEVRSGMED